MEGATFTSTNTSTVQPEAPAALSGCPQANVLLELSERAVALFTCPICYQLLSTPVVTPCGHTFCLGCFNAWRNHVVAFPRARQLACPVCRRALPRSYELSEQPLAPCVALAEAIEQLCPEQHRERVEQCLLEQRQGGAAERGAGARSSRGSQVEAASGRSTADTVVVHAATGSPRGPRGGRGPPSRRRWWRLLRHLPPPEYIVGAVLYIAYMGHVVSDTARTLHGIVGCLSKVHNGSSGSAGNSGGSCTAGGVGGVGLRRAGPVGACGASQGPDRVWPWQRGGNRRVYIHSSTRKPRGSGSGGGRSISSDTLWGAIFRSLRARVLGADASRAWAAATARKQAAGHSPSARGPGSHAAPGRDAAAVQPRMWAVAGA